MKENLVRARNSTAAGRTGSGRQPGSVWSTLLVACLLTQLIGGCGKPAASIRQLSSDAVVLAFGDSLTSGKGAAEEDTYPSVLARLTGYAVVNAGRSGERTGTGLERLPSELKSHQPDLVILCHGGNDMLQKVDPDETAANLNAMIAMIQQSGADVILIGVPQPGIFLSPAPVYEELARQHRIPSNVEIVGKILGDASLKSDHIHPNDRGYRLLAETVAELMSESQSS